MEREALEDFLERLDPRSRAIVEYLVRHRYASLDQLTKVAGLANQMETLQRIGRLINPLAQKIWKRSLAQMRRSWVDPASGQIVSYHWWIDEKCPLSIAEVSGSAAKVEETDTELLVLVRPRAGVTLTGSAEVLVRPGAVMIRLAKQNAVDGSGSPPGGPDHIATGEGVPHDTQDR
jgi:hypothetical protein